MRPDFIPPGQELSWGIGPRGRAEDFVPGPPPDDLPLDQGGSGKAVPPDGVETPVQSASNPQPPEPGSVAAARRGTGVPNQDVAPAPEPVPEIIVKPIDGPPPSAIMSPGPATVPPTEAQSSERKAQSEGPDPGPSSELCALSPELPPAPRARMTKAQREAAAQEAIAEAQRLQAEAEAEDDEDEVPGGSTVPGAECLVPGGEETTTETPETGAKGGEVDRWAEELPQPPEFPEIDPPQPGTRHQAPGTLLPPGTRHAAKPPKR